MAAAFRVVVADRKDVEVVTIVCPECGAELSIAIQTAGIPESCPSCQMQYTKVMVDGLVALGRFHRNAAIAEEQIGKSIFRFAIKDKA
jgi:uncharacterized protein (UPF0212 family)